MGYGQQSGNAEDSIAQMQADLATELAQIWQRTKGTTLDRVQDLTTIVSTLETDQFDSDRQQQAIRTAHKLAGSLGTFGFDQGSRIAKELEVLFQGQTNRPNLRQKATSLIQDLQVLLQADPPIVAREETNSDASHSGYDFGTQRYLLVLEPDQKFCQNLQAEATTWKFKVKPVPNLHIATQMLRERLPDAVLLNMDWVQSDGAKAQFFQLMAACQPAPPFLALSNQESLSNRLTALKLGANVLLQKPITPSQIFSALNRILESDRPILAKVLLVDDDPQVLELVQSLLQTQGFQTVGLQEPEHFWETLRAVQPDLLILDVEMPGLDGLSLCQLVRNDFQWSWLPVLFLSNHGDVETLQQAFCAGADDFIAKPIVPPDFMVRVMNRLQRSRLYRTQIEVDLLTGIANRHGGTRSFDQLLHLAIQSQQPLCLATLDLDHFKTINDRYGHEEGDRLLHEFGEFLKSKCRSDDVLEHRYSSHLP